MEEIKIELEIGNYKKPLGVVHAEKCRVGIRRRNEEAVSIAPGGSEFQGIGPNIKGAVLIV